MRGPPKESVGYEVESNPARCRARFEVALRRFDDLLLQLAQVPGLGRDAALPSGIIPGGDQPSRLFAAAHLESNLFQPSPIFTPRGPPRKRRTDLPSSDLS